MSGQRRAAVVGTGLIGGSIGLALRRAGWHVTGTDSDHSGARRALDRGALDAIGTDFDAEITFIATPVGSVLTEVARALESSSGVVTDVGSVMLPIAAEIDAPRFVAGHPMAGSEQVGVEGASADLFEGAVWVLSPGEHTADSTYLQVRSVIASFGTDVISMPGDRHDALVAVVSHVPHLAAATLMRLADQRAEDHRVLLRLAAGGFRDMTRIAAGHPGIWPDICVENSGAIAGVLDSLIDELAAVRELVREHDRDGLLGVLEGARQARQNLPAQVTPTEDLAVIRVPIPDRPGMLAEVTTLATDLDINILDIEIAHSTEGDRGILIIVVPSAGVDQLSTGLADRGFRSSVRSLE